METDGRIRSKNIGTGEINSRTLDNIRSSNYDGSHDDPEGDPGTQGWQILKNGFVVINEALVRGTLKAATIISAVIEGGIVRLGSGGSIELGGDPETGTPATATLSETGIEIGPTSLTSSGLTVGSNVEMNATGLFLDGGEARAVDISGSESSVTGATLTTTATERTFHTIAVPSWATTAIVQNFSQVQSNNGGFGTMGIICSARIDSVNDGGAQNDTDGLTVLSTHVTTKVLSSFGATIRISCFANRNGGTGNPTNATCVTRSLVVFLR